VDPIRPLRAFDRLQRRTPALAFPVAVVKKFSDDQAGHLSALIAYWGFFSLFPLLLVLVTGLGFVLAGDQHLSDQIVRGTFGRIPVIGDTITRRELRGSVPALVIGSLGALWAGLGITLATQNAMDHIWSVPFRERRNFLFARLRGLLVLAVVGGLNIAASVASGLVAGGLGGTALQIAGFAISLVLDLLLFWTAFRLLTSRRIPTRHLAPGIVMAAVGWAVLQALGGLFVERVITRANATYGTFAVVIGLLTWIYLGARMVLLAAEANVVRERRLWPRSLFAPSTAADVKALRALARVEERNDEERVEVTFLPRSED
jgi:YihY family inner membrane protein